MTEPTTNSAPQGALAGAVTTPDPATPDPATPAPAAAGWLQSLTDDSLRGSELLARYETVDALAKAHEETTRWARGRVPLPKGDDAAAREDFIAKARPAAASDYEVALPEGADGTRADAFREKAYQLGLMPWQAKELADWSNAFETDAVSRMGQAAQDELKTREINLGPAGYARTLAAIGNMMATAGIKDAETAMNGLESAFGAGAAFDMLAHFAGKTGELEKVDVADISMRTGTMQPDSAQAEIGRLMGDRDFMQKAQVAGTPEARKWADLNARAAGL